MIGLHKGYCRRTLQGCKQHMHEQNFYFLIGICLILSLLQYRSVVSFMCSGTLHVSQYPGYYITEQMKKLLCALWKSKTSGWCTVSNPYPANGKPVPVIGLTSAC